MTRPCGCATAEGESCPDCEPPCESYCDPEAPCCRVCDPAGAAARDAEEQGRWQAYALGPDEVAS